jgi:hypothetical protein
MACVSSGVVARLGLALSSALQERESDHRSWGYGYVPEALKPAEAGSAAVVVGAHHNAPAQAQGEETVLASAALEADHHPCCPDRASSVAPV